jgi:hypothetical protein
MEIPFADDIFVILNTNFNRLASINTDSVKVNCISGHRDLGDCEICSEVDGILGSVLDVDWNQVPLTTILGSLASRHDSFKQNRLVWHNFLGLVWLNCKSCDVEQFLIKVKADRDLATICQSE